MRLNTTRSSNINKCTRPQPLPIQQRQASNNKKTSPGRSSPGTKASAKPTAASKQKQKSGYSLCVTRVLKIQLLPPATSEIHGVTSKKPTRFHLLPTNSGKQTETKKKSPGKSRARLMRSEGTQDTALAPRATSEIHGVKASAQSDKKKKRSPGVIPGQTRLCTRG